MLGMKSFTERRIAFSRLLLLLWIALFALTHHKWDEGGLMECSLTWSAVILIGIAMLGRIWCSIYICGYKNRMLLQTGPYSLCRHPLYFFTFLGVLGIGFSTESLVLAVLLALFYWLYYPAVMKKEEVALTVLFGKHYTSYCMKVPRFFPNIKNFRQANSISVNPTLMQKRLWESFWFLTAIPIAGSIEYLHLQQVLPILFNCY